MGTCGNCGCQTLDAYILLDRSGSMSGRWSEALGSINAYVKELAKGSATVTLATFDSVGDMKYEVLRDAVPSAEWKDVTDADAQPRGGTPLLDAIGRAVSAIESRAGDKKILIVMTDGEENQSREMNKVSAKAALDRFEKRGWQVVFLGADFDAFGQAATVGVGTAKVMRLHAGSYACAMADLGAKSFAYSNAGTEVAFNDEDRARAAGGVTT